MPVGIRTSGSFMLKFASGLLSVFLCLIAAPIQAQIMYGKPVAIDGDTLDFGGQRVRLFGIDAPERAQTCTRNGEAWPCGEDAKALLQSLVGEMRKADGEVVFGGSVSYVPQAPWIMNATLRENVLFGQPDDEKRCVTTFGFFLLVTIILILMGRGIGLMKSLRLAL